MLPTGHRTRYNIPVDDRNRPLESVGNLGLSEHVHGEFAYDGQHGGSDRARSCCISAVRSVPHAGSLHGPGGETGGELGQWDHYARSAAGQPAGPDAADGDCPGPARLQSQRRPRAATPAGADLSGAFAARCGSRLRHRYLLGCHLGGPPWSASGPGGASPGDQPGTNAAGLGRILARGSR